MKNRREVLNQVRFPKLLAGVTRLHILWVAN